MKIIALFLAATLALGPMQSAAQDVDLSPEIQVAVDEAEALGELLYRYDQAAWHGTDAFLEQLNESRDLEIMRGYVIVPGERGRLDAIFFGEMDGQRLEVARYAVEGSRVLQRTYHDPANRPPLSALASRLAMSRQAALDAMIAEDEIGFCADAVPNTIALPPDADNTVDVYILTPPTSNDSYPLGGHYRLTMAADDEVVEWRRFLNTCFDLRLASPDGNGQEPLMTFVTHLLDPQPTEIHFFASRYFTMRMAIGTTDNRLVWFIENGQLQEVTTFAD